MFVDVKLFEVRRTRLRLNGIVVGEAQKYKVGLVSQEK